MLHQNLVANKKIHLKMTEKPSSQKLFILFLWNLYTCNKFIITCAIEKTIYGRTPTVISEECVRSV